MRSLSIPVLLAAALAADSGPAQAPDWNAAQPVTIELSSFKFTPSTVNLQHGTPYRLRLSNTSSKGHDFVSKEFFAATTIAPADQAKVKQGGVEVGGEESVEVRIVPNEPGSYKVHCSHFMHSTFGMTGTITVR